MSGCECHGLERPDPLAEGCQCGGCQALRAELEIDGSLDPHLGCHLLIKGWAGGLSDGEKAYVQVHADWARAATRAIRGKGRQFVRVASVERKSDTIPPTDAAEAISA
jgi:hypothetical protein